MWRFLFLFPLLLSAEITAIYLSWYGDPTTTMTIQWHTDEDEYGDELKFGINEKWFSTTGSHHSLENTLVHTVSLENLKPDTEYSFHIENDAKIYKFRTAPIELKKEPLRFVIGGDLYASPKLFRRMSKTVMEKDPLFAVLGGDLAYALNPIPFASKGLRRWTSFLSDWQNHMITSDDRLIPFLVVSGNHDISPDNYEMFFSLFAFPKKQLYRAIDFGNYLSLILLDTGHFQPIEGRQTLWLDKALLARQNIPYRFAVYHEGAYPSFYPYQATNPKKIRTHWTPLFDKYKLSAAFENHNHAFKKTHPLKAHKIDEEGIIYFGDGGWGAPARNTTDYWYLDKRGRKNTVFLIELTKTDANIKTYDILNNLIDTTDLQISK